MCRIPAQRRKHKGGRKPREDNVSQSSYDSDTNLDYLLDFSPSESYRFCRSKRPSPPHPMWSLAFVLILSLVVPIVFFGLSRIYNLLRPTGNKVTSSPVSSSSPVITACPDNMIKIMMRMEELQTELGYMKEKLKYQFPDADLWANFALETQGAKVHTKRSSSTYNRIAGIKILGVELSSRWSPVTVIQGRHPPIPGNCWSFPGSHGNLLIELSHAVTVSHVTLDHVLTSVSPTDAISSAPRHFSVYGLGGLNDEAVHLGNFVYDLDGNPSQTFKVKVDDATAFKYIDVRIETNYGHADYTCLYGFRVHGKS